MDAVIHFDVAGATGLDAELGEALTDGSQAGVGDSIVEYVSSGMMGTWVEGMKTEGSNLEHGMIGVNTGESAVATSGKETVLLSPLEDSTLLQEGTMDHVEMMEKTTPPEGWNQISDKFDQLVGDLDQFIEDNKEAGNLTQVKEVNPTVQASNRTANGPILEVSGAPKGFTRSQPRVAGHTRDQSADDKKHVKQARSRSNEAGSDRTMSPQKVRSIESTSSVASVAETSFLQKRKQKPQSGVLQGDVAAEAKDGKVPKVLQVSMADTKDQNQRRSSVDDGRKVVPVRNRLVWTPSLHKKFTRAIEIVGIDNAVPRTILEVMKVNGLTTEHVKSHLQKYRNCLRKATEDVRPEGHKRSMGLEKIGLEGKAKTASQPGTRSEELGRSSSDPKRSRIDAVEQHLELHERTIQLQLQLQLAVHKASSLYRKSHFSSLDKVQRSLANSPEHADVCDNIKKLMLDHREIQKDLESQQRILREHSDEQEEIRQRLYKILDAERYGVLGT